MRDIMVKTLLNHKHVRRSPLAEVIAVLDRLLEAEILDGVDVARVLGTSPRSVTRWQASRSTPRRDTEERLLELKAVVDLLRRLWLRSPNPDLGPRVGTRRGRRWGTSRRRV